MGTALLEVGLAPTCVLTDNRERKYYLMKRFVRAALKHSKRATNKGVKIVAYLCEECLDSMVFVNGDAPFDSLAGVFCTPAFTNDERRQILTSIEILPMNYHDDCPIVTKHQCECWNIKF